MAMVSENHLTRFVRIYRSRDSHTNPLFIKSTMSEHKTKPLMGRVFIFERAMSTTTKKHPSPYINNESRILAFRGIFA